MVTFINLQKFKTLEKRMFLFLLIFFVLLILRHCFLFGIKP